MPSSLSKPRAKKVRDLLYSNWNPSNVAGYDPSLATSDSDFVALTTNWERHGSHNPAITVTNFDGNAVDGGETGWTSVQGDGSGVNQTRSESGLVTLHVKDDSVDGVSYNGGNGAEALLKLLDDEVTRIIQANAAGDGEVLWYSIGPFEESPQNSLEGAVKLQWQARVGFGWTRTP